jgi:uncharacterized protein (DUF362 family)
MPTQFTRREWLTTASALPIAYFAGASLLRADAPASPVAIARVKTYSSSELLPAMQKMFDQLGGLDRLVKGKTVAIKINLTGAPSNRLRNLAIEETHYTHPLVIAAATHLIGRAGARRIRILESAYSSSEPLEQHLQRAHWTPQDILGAAPHVEFENTGFLGKGPKYSRLTTSHGGYIFPGFDLNHSYQDCDVFVSLAKMKEHSTAGVTLSMKNLFGIPPYTIYGVGAGVDEPSLVPQGPFRLFHDGGRGPSKSAPQERNPNSPREDTYRVPRIVTDLVSARPIHLAIVEGVKTMTAGEGPWVQEEKLLVAPGLIVAGFNPVSTDAVAMALMGYDPMADRGTPPFERCDSTLRLAEDAGLGTRDLRRIDVRGATIAEAKFDFAAIRRKRRGS